MTAAEIFSRNLIRRHGPTTRKVRLHLIDVALERCNRAEFAAGLRQFNVKSRDELVHAIYEKISTS